METTASASPSSVAIKWTIFSFLTSIILTYVFQFAGIGQTSSLKYITFIPYIAFLFLAQKEFRDRSGGFMTYGQGFMTGFLFAVFTAILTTIFIYIYYTMLSPGTYDGIVKSTKDQMMAKGLDEETAAKMTATYASVTFLTIATLLGGVITGTIISLIGAAIFKKERTAADILRQDDSYSDPA